MRTDRKADTAFWQPHLQPKPPSAGKPKKKRKSNNDNDKEEFRNYLNTIFRKIGKDNYEIENPESFYYYIYVLDAVKLLETDIKQIIKIYDELLKNKESSFPSDISRKIELMKKLRNQFLMMDNNNNKKKNTRKYI
jgi:hypothetical protein